MAKRMKKRIFAGPVCEQVVYSISDRVQDPKNSKPKPRFKNEEERADHRNKIALRNFIRLCNANFTPAGYFCTLTLDQESECHTYDEARIIGRNFRRRFLYKYPQAKIVMVMGRGKSTSRIHFHALIEGEGITEADIMAAWKDGAVARVDHLRAHNHADGIDMGADLTQVATYMLKHWKPEQGGHRYAGSRNLVKPEEEKATECVRDYTPEHPPVAPKGFELVGCTWNQYGYMVFKYVLRQEKKQSRRGGSAGPCI